VILTVGLEVNMLIIFVDDKRVRNSEANESEGSSRCMLKSPVIRN